MNIVWFAEIKWDYLRTRKQQIISRKPADIDLLYLEPYVKGRANRFELRREGDLYCATIPFIKSIPSAPWRHLLGSGSGRAVIDTVARLRIKQLLKKLNFREEETGFVLSNIYAIDVASRLRSTFLIYDCNDAHDAFPGMPAWTKEYYRRACDRADVVFGSSRDLMERALSMRAGRGCAYLGNGVEYDHFALDESTIRERIAAEKIRLGYIGAIAPWLDFDILTALANRHPEWEIVLAGPVLLGVERKVDELTALPNVHRLEPVSYERVPEILRQFSIGLIPFVYNDLTRGVNPNKLYEYLASGLPVVSTKFSPEVLVDPDAVRAADDANGFIAACEETVTALADRPRAMELALEAQRFARRNDWSVIADTFWRDVKKMMTPGAASARLE